MKEILAYIDPGSGFVFLQQTSSFFWLMILSLFGFIVLFTKLFFRVIKKILWIFAIVIVILITGALMNNSFGKNKVVILGIDAMDPVITEKLINEGALPNFAYLKKEGTYSKLKTTNPPESVVAWKSFATGVNPGKHGIFDFVMRNPKNYMLYSGLDEIPSSHEVKVKNCYKADPFWSYLSRYHISSSIFFCPKTFPAKKLNGKMLSGMGTPDLYGTMGRFSFYTTRKISEDKIKDSRGKIICVILDNDIIKTNIYGPKVNLKGSVSEAEIPLKITLGSGQNGAKIEFQNKSFFVKKDSWSCWQRLYFKLGAFKKIYGIARFYLKDTGTDFELYMSPINLDPENPAFPISYPGNYSKKIARKIGLYYTLGMPNETWALSEELLDDKAFLEQVDVVLNERRYMLAEELKGFKKGLVFMYIDTLDVVQHMFWRGIDSSSPLFTTNSLYKNTIYTYYKKIDSIVGDVLKKLDKDTTLIILSDHGFNSFHRAVNLNSWLMKNGFLVLNQGKSQGEEFFKDIDWSKTKAYALGLGGIYINIKGRESQGIVSPEEEILVRNEISAKLKLWVDPITQNKVAKDVYKKEDIFNGPYMNMAPDLFVGFNSSFRASWQTALGATPETLIEDNNRKWSGDHIIDPSLVPGILFINRKTELAQPPSIIDLCPTILKLFKVNLRDKFDGKAINIFNMPH